MMDIWEPCSFWEGLVLWLRMDEKSGGTVFDHSAYSNHGIAYGAEPTGLGWDFSETSDYIDCGSDDILDITDAITIEAWIKPSSLPFSSWSRIIRKNTDITGLTDGYGFRGRGGFSHIQIWVGNGSSTSFCYLPITTDWNHIVMVYKSGSGGWGYVNGEEKSTLNDVGDIDPCSGTSLLLGCSSNAFCGIIAGIRIYRRALDAEEVKLSYDLNKGLFS